jgi:hypothetical protein
MVCPLACWRQHARSKAWPKLPLAPVIATVLPLTVLPLTVLPSNVTMALAQTATDAPAWCNPCRRIRLLDG